MWTDFTKCKQIAVRWNKKQTRQVRINIFRLYKKLLLRDNDK